MPMPTLLCDSCGRPFAACAAICPHCAGRLVAPARVASTPLRSPAVGRPNALRDVLRMLEQALAYSGATDRERCKREELLRSAVALLASELGSNATTPQQTQR